MINDTKKNLGKSISLLFFLAMLGVPRVIAHDLNWIEPGSFVNMLLVFIPSVVWIVVVLWKRATSPFKALLIVGIFYGILLGITHQILWDLAFNTPPKLGGNLSDISPLANAFITRIFGFISSLLTGTIIGMITGVIGSLIKHIRS